MFRDLTKDQKKKKEEIICILVKFILIDVYYLNLFEIFLRTSVMTRLASFSFRLRPLGVCVCV